MEKDFQEVYDLYFKDVYKYIFSLCRNKVVAEEITQETFLKALKSINSFNGSCKLYVWLCQIAKNTYFSYCKKEKRFNYDDNLEEEKNDTSIENGLLSKDSAFEIHKVLHKLDQPYKEVFTLRIFGELSFSQIGELFGKTEGWARVTYHRARIKIKEELM